MTVLDMKRIALQLANTYWVRRYYCWLNYPQEPQAVCISIMDPQCKYPDADRLMAEMNALGFTWETKYGITGFHATVTPEEK